MVWKRMSMQTVIIVAAVIFAFLWFQQCDRNSKLRAELKLEQKKNDQNLAAMNEVIKIVKKQNGDIEASKAAYIGSLADLKQYNEKLYQQLQDQKGLLAGLHADINIKLDSLLSKGDKPVQYNDSTYGIKFNAKYDDMNLHNSISGETKFTVRKKEIIPIHTMIFSNEMKIGITYGFREFKDRYEVFAVSKSDKITFDELEGFYTLKKDGAQKKLKWGLGPQVGVTYSLGSMKFMPYVGLGLSYNIVRF